eukprot:gene1434-1637_t
MKSGGLFCTKLLALPCRVEHSTEFIAFCTGADSSIKQSELISWLVDVDDQVSTGGFTESSRSVVPVCCAEDAIWLGQRELLLVVSFASDHFAAVNTFARKGRSWELTHNLSDKPSVFAGRGPLITGTEMLASDSSGSTWMEFWRAAIKAKAMPIIQISVPIGEMVAVLLHADGYVTIISLTAAPTAGKGARGAIEADRVGLPWPPGTLSYIGAENASPPSSITPATTSSLHFLSARVCVAVTRGGDVGLFELRQDCRGFVWRDADALPPRLGPAVCTLRSVPSPSSSLVGSGLLCVRQADVWTGQLFTMTVIDSGEAVRDKVRKGQFRSALDLCARLGLDADLVRVAQWRALVSDGTVKRAHVVEVLRVVRDAESVVSESLDFSGEDPDLWAEIIDEGIRRSEEMLFTSFPRVREWVQMVRTKSDWANDGDLLVDRLADGTDVTADEMVRWLRLLT